MFAAVRLTLSFLTVKERAKYYALISARALSGLLDIFGIALIAFIASVAANRVDPTSTVPAPLVAGVALPTIESSNLIWLVTAVLAVFIIKAVAAILLMRTQAHFVARVETRNANRIAMFLLTGSLTDARRHSKAEVQFALTGSMTYAFTGLLNNLAGIVSESFLLTAITVTFFIVNPIAAIGTLAYFGLIVIVIQGLIGRSFKRAGREAVAGTIETTNSLNDTLDTFREISVMHKQAVFIDRIGRSRARIAKSGATMTSLGGMPRYVVETALIVGVVILVTQQLLANELGSGLVTVGVFLAGGVRLMASLLPLQSAVSNLAQNSEQAAPALELLREDRNPGIRTMEDSGSRKMETMAGPRNGLSLRLDNVSFRYPASMADSVRDVSLEIAPGEYVAMIGPSGAGKTTIVDLILGLIEPAAGAISIQSLTPVQLRRMAPGSVTYVPQKPGLVSGTIGQNIALGVDSSDIDAALLDEVVDAAHLREFLDSLPDGLDTSVGKQVDSLSGGQIQRIGLARALYSRPRLLVLDEATSGLDAGSEAFISSTLRALHGSVTVIVIAHRLSSIQHADRVYVVERGTVTASGTFTKIREEVPMVAEYVKLMSFGTEVSSEERAG